MKLSKKYPVYGTFASNPFPDGIHFDLINSKPNILPFSKVRYAVIFSAVSKIDFCKSHPELSRKINIEGIKSLLLELRKWSVFPIYASSDGVYPGIDGDYLEACQEPAIHVYGEHKREIEVFIEKHFQEYCILRFSKVVGYDEKKSDLLSDLHEKLIAGRVLKLVQNQKFQVISLSDMVAVIEQVAQQELTGIYNIATPETVSRKELAVRLANLLEIKNLKIQELPVSYFNFVDKRATNPSMRIDRFCNASGFTFESVDEILSNFLKEAQSH
jgi:dTDP-4-dehydrorhamnose reductase